MARATIVLATDIAVSEDHGPLPTSWHRGTRRHRVHAPAGRRHERDRAQNRARQVPRIEGGAPQHVPCRNPCLYYRGSAAQRRHEEKRLFYRRPRLLDDPAPRSLVQRKILEGRRSPEQIAGRIAIEPGGRTASAATIYRAINGRALDTQAMRQTRRGMRGRLRHRGKRRRRHSERERRGRIAGVYDNVWPADLIAGDFRKWLRKL